MRIEAPLQAPIGQGSSLEKVQAPENPEIPFPDTSSSSGPQPAAASLKEISVSPPPMEDVSESVSLSDSSSSGNIPVKIATAIYALNHSFDLQKQALDLLI